MKYHAQIINAFASLKHFIGESQMMAIADICQGEERQGMFAILLDLSETVLRMPKTYDTQEQSDPIVHLHYFMCNMDWHITEKDAMEEQHQAFGMADLGDGGELGYISIEEITASGVQIDLHWTPCKLSEVKQQR